jgi:hypothetical protein
LSSLLRLWRGCDLGANADDSAAINLGVKHDGTVDLHCPKISQGTLAPLTKLSESIYLSVLQNSLLDVDLLVISAPWTDSVEWQQMLRPGRRTVVLASCGYLSSHWHDGPLAHINARHEVASLIPSGGYGELLIPVNTNESAKGLALSEIAVAEGDDGERGHRVLIAALRETFRPNENTLTLAIDKLDLRSAVELTLIRQALPSTQLDVVIQAPLPPKWRRLLQNINVRHTANGATTAVALPNLVPEAYVPGIALSINSVSDVLPRLMLST